MKGWTAALPAAAFGAGLVVFIAMFPYHPTVDLDLVSYLIAFVPLGLVLAGFGAAAWATRRRPAAVSIVFAAVAAGFALLALMMVEWRDLDGVWGILFHVPFLVGSLGCLAFAALWPLQRWPKPAATA